MTDSRHGRLNAALTAHARGQIHQAGLLHRIRWWHRYQNAAVWTSVLLAGVGAGALTALFGARDQTPLPLIVVGTWIASEVAWLCAMYGVDWKINTLLDALERGDPSDRSTPSASDSPTPRSNSPQTGRP